MPKCIVCNNRYSQRYSALCRVCSEKQISNKWGKENEQKKIESKFSDNKESHPIDEGLYNFFKWAFSPIGTHHHYRGVTIKNPFPKILSPIVTLLMIISALPVLIIFAPFWVYFKIEALIKKEK